MHPISMIHHWNWLVRERLIASATGFAQALVDLRQSASCRSAVGTQAIGDVNGKRLRLCRNSTAVACAPSLDRQFGLASDLHRGRLDRATGFDPAKRDGCGPVDHESRRIAISMRRAASVRPPKCCTHAKKEFCSFFRFSSARV